MSSCNCHLQRDLLSRLVRECASFLNYLFFFLLVLYVFLPSSLNLSSSSLPQSRSFSVFIFFFFVIPCLSVFSFSTLIVISL